MSKLEELIQQLCPDGVEYKPLGEVCKLSRGRVYSKDYLRDNPGEYPVYSSQTANDGELGKINTYDCEGDYLTWTTDGAYAGTIFHRSGKFSITNVCGLIKVENSLLTIRFLYYWLSITAKGYVYQGMGNPKLMTNQIEVIPIPLPPLPIQEEIVRILDKFTQVTAELKAELKARKDEYDYYRNQLLTFDASRTDVEWKKISDICAIIKGEYITKKDTVPGTIPVILGGQEPAYYINKFNHEGKAIVISRSGASAGFVSFWNEPIFVTDGFLLEPKTDLNIEYLYYSLKNKEQAIQSLKRGAGVPHITTNHINDLQFPIPPLAEQQRIVDILDRFEKLTNDMSEGIPAEIEVTQQMYEYYRDKLLTFKKKEE